MKNNNYSIKKQPMSFSKGFAYLLKSVMGMNNSNDAYTQNTLVQDVLEDTADVLSVSAQKTSPSSIDAVVNSGDGGMRLQPRKTQVIEQDTNKLIDYSSKPFDEVSGIIPDKRVRKKATQLNNVVKQELAKQVKVDVSDVESYIGGPVVDNHTARFGKQASSAVFLYAVFPDNVFYAHAPEKVKGNLDPITNDHMKLAIDIVFGIDYDVNKPHLISDISSDVDGDSFGVMFKVPTVDNYDKGTLKTIIDHTPSVGELLAKRKFKSQGLDEHDSSVYMVISDKSTFNHYNPQ